MSEAADEAVVRARLPHTWHAFFARFGRMTEAQRHAVLPIVAGRDTLVAAPTAGGKTEAVVAPLVERAIAATGDGTQLLVVAPTRALVNDLHRRLTAPITATGLRLGRKSGDANFDVARPPHVLVTTPESLDSMLARRTAVLRGVRSVMLDELHLLDGTVRGDQLRCLLERLERVATERPQRCAASATVADNEALAGRYLAPDAVYATAGGARRTISGKLEHAVTLEHAAASIRGALDTAGRKLLVFTNSRSQVEMLSAMLASDPLLRPRVYAHHGSLARGERIRVERGFMAATSGVCVATMTLELGVDIGDVDLVVLVAPPPDVSSLLQRVGRGNRRGGPSRVLGLYADAFERRRFEHLLECAADEQLFGEDAGFRPNVIAQQAIGLAFQNPKGWIDPRVVHGRLPPAVAAEWPLGDVEQVLAELVIGGALRPIDNGRFVPDEPTKTLFKRGTVHSLIEDSHETEVVDAVTGRSLGRARFSQKERDAFEAGHVSLALGGQRRDVTRVRDDKVYVTSGEGVEEARFIARQAPRYSAALATDLARSLGLEAGEMRLEQIGEKRWRLAHFLGTVWGRLLGVLMESGGLGKAASGPFFAHLKRAPAGDDLGLGTEAAISQSAAAAIERQHKRFRRLLGAGAMAEAVPRELMERWVQAGVDVDGFARRVATSRLREATLDFEMSP